MSNPYLELFMLKFDGKITQSELETKIKELKSKGFKPTHAQINEILDISENDDGVNYD